MISFSFVVRRSHCLWMKLNMLFSYVIKVCKMQFIFENICRGSMTDIRVRVGFRVLLFGAGADPGKLATGRGGVGYRKTASGRVRVEKHVPVQDSS